MAKLFTLWHSHGWHPVRSALGGAAGIVLTALTGLLLALTGTLPGAMPLLMAPIGASAVLAFAVPASPLAQPRAIIGGNVISALAGLLAGRFLPFAPGFLVAAVAVGAAIVVMQALRCLHPPGGAVALMTAMGGPAIAKAGFSFALYPVALNSIMLVMVAWVYNNLSGSRYPHRPEALPEHALPTPAGYRRAHLDAVLAELEDLPDVDADDLDSLVRAVITRMQSQPAMP